MTGRSHRFYCQPASTRTMSAAHPIQQGRLPGHASRALDLDSDHIALQIDEAGEVRIGLLVHVPTDDCIAW
ncbi:hypothetical protein [Xanthomonas albilineans]|uniref:hypothetical protein n=2 Tax=Xanthomonas albilineans TaxID=29447 RepID=UPI000AA010CC|nr:hypothetical protein [Xanthomonas albilineans]